jgi:hypothetical protein
MMKKRTGPATMILIVATCAFVVNVLSPATPTPVAQSPISLLVVLLTLACFSLSLACATVPLTGHGLFPRREVTAARPAARALIALICVLLC